MQSKNRCIRVSDEDWASWQGLAEKCKCGLTEVLKRAMSAYAEHGIHKVSEKESLTEILTKAKSGDTIIVGGQVLEPGQTIASMFENRSISKRKLKPTPIAEVVESMKKQAKHRGEPMRKPQPHPDKPKCQCNACIRWRREQ